MTFGFREYFVAHFILLFKAMLFLPFQKSLLANPGLLTSPFSIQIFLDHLITCISLQCINR